ncbi:MAG: hypothetical protein LBR62_01370, partial [Puniceicoccales bacterium]|nr:hypothetical protein [Puniceicoccales bacterium]
MKKVFLTVCFGMGLLALTGMGEEPRCWNEWVDIKGAEDFVSAAQSGMVSEYCGKDYGEIVPEKVNKILTSAQIQGPETEIAAYWFLSKYFRPVDRNIACTVDAKLNEKMGPAFSNLDICGTLYRYYE